MPKYTFVCKNCGNTKQKMVSRSKHIVDCDVCESEMDRQLPSLSGSPTVNETIDSYSGIVQPANQQETVQKRSDEYYWTVEVPRLVNSGTYSLETMLEMGWVTLDDKKQIRIQDKPPHRR